MTMTSSSKFFLAIAAAALLGLGGIGTAVAQQMPDRENGRYALSPVRVSSLITPSVTGDST